MPATTVAQSSDGDDRAYWQISYYNIDFTKMDSLESLWILNEPVVALRKERGEILESINLIHQQGNEHNVMQMTKFPSWSAINASSDAYRTYWADDDERAGMNDGFAYIYGAGAHQDGIYFERPGSIMPSSDDAEGAYWYASYYKIDQTKMQGLNQLWRATADVSAEAVHNGSILGRLILVHHTGVLSSNVIFLTKYPSWDALEYRGLGDAARTVEPDSLQRVANGAGFQRAFENNDHYDVIYRDPR